MNLDDFTIAVCWVIDETVPPGTGGQRLRPRGPYPVLADSEVQTMAVVASTWAWSRIAPYR